MSWTRDALLDQEGMRAGSTSRLMMEGRDDLGLDLRGIWTTNFVPSPGLESTSMVPP